MADWFGVRCVLQDPDGAYEERVTIWQADSFDEAVLLAEAEATEYGTEVGRRLLGFAQAYVMPDGPGQGRAVFSLVRDSDLDPEEYLDTFFDTGDEQEESLDDEDEGFADEGFDGGFADEGYGEDDDEDDEDDGEDDEEDEDDEETGT